jgi:hypothetical protein
MAGRGRDDARRGGVLVRFDGLRDVAWCDSGTDRVVDQLAAAQAVDQLVRRCPPSRAAAHYAAAVATGAATRRTPGRKMFTKWRTDATREVAA